jgi:hypothetical protein
VRARPLIASGAVALGLIVAGCGASSSGSAPATSAVNPAAAEVNPAGDIPDNQAFVRYSPPGSGYSVKVPEGWARTSASGVVTFTDKLNAIGLESHPAGAPLTVATARSAELPKLARQVKGFHAGDVGTVSRSAGAGVLITYAADAPVDPVTGRTGVDAVERYAFFHSGTEVILTLSGPKGADNVDPWMIVSNSLRWTP